ncbi:hypothetical protein BCR44DRAFT_23236 [Catenaria anguillulae PL171]|uniref:Uncharacterized protein n=1 Tax=Catenaria anguillulae PL171 TaxID=765915 RepID=A0A1Y2HL82_9FUNG|nr:hypothetical protein BCR44DRAFT_23236 [Catenaria anguillulae PL171]
MSSFQRSFINVNAVQVRRVHISDPRFAPYEFTIRDHVIVTSSPALNPGAGAATLFVIGHLRTNPRTAPADEHGRVVLNVEVEQQVQGLARPEPIEVRVRLYRGRAFKNRGTAQWLFPDSRVLVSGPLLRAQSATLDNLMYMDGSVIGLIPDWVEIEHEDTIFQLANSFAAATPHESAASGQAPAGTNGVVPPPPTDASTLHGLAVSAPLVVGASQAPLGQSSPVASVPQTHSTQAPHGNRSGRSR